MPLFNTVPLTDIQIIASGLTTNATPSIVYSYPVSQLKCIKVQIEYTAYKTDFTLAASGNLFATFARASGGNLVRTSGTGTSGLDGIVQGNFSNAQPKPDLIANSSNNTIDVTLTGKASISITWQMKLTIIPYN